MFLFVFLFYVWMIDSVEIVTIVYGGVGIRREKIVSFSKSLESVLSFDHVFLLFMAWAGRDLLSFEKKHAMI